MAMGTFRPWRKALLATRTLPAGVRGPVLLEDYGGWRGCARRASSFGRLDFGELSVLDNGRGVSQATRQRLPLTSLFGASGVSTLARPSNAVARISATHRHLLRGLKIKQPDPVWRWITVREWREVAGNFDTARFTGSARDNTRSKDLFRRAL